MEKKKSHNKTLLIVIIILLVFFMLLGIFIGTKITSKEDAKRPSLQEKKDSPKEEEIIEEVSIGYISSFDSIRDNMTYLPTYNKKIKSSEIPKLDILSTTINNIFNVDSSEDNALLFEDIKNYVVKNFDIISFDYYPNELYTWKYHMFAIRYYKLTKENNLYRIIEVSKEDIPPTAVVTKKSSDTKNNTEMIPLKITKQGEYTNVYVAKAIFVQEKNFGFYNTNNEQVCYKLQYNNETKQYDCILSNNIVENYMEKFEIYKYIYKYENDTYKLISINS